MSSPTRILVPVLAAIVTLGSASSAGAIVGGTPAKVSGSTVVLRIEGPGTSVKLCTGTLVARSVVLTAGHCVEDFDRIRVLAGLLDYSVFPKASDDFIVTKVQESRDFEKGSKFVGPNDLAYLELGRNATQTPTAITFGRPKVATNQRARGYGAIAENANGDPVPEGANLLLREALVRIVGCPTSTKNPRTDIFCSNYTKSTPKAGPCRGDSGGPLLSSSTGKLLGVLSGSSAGCQSNATWIDVAQHQPFIAEALSSRVTGRVFNREAVTAAEAKGTRPDDARIANKVASAVVKARRQDGTLQSSTPIVNGRFTLPVKKGTYDLEVIAKGFKTLKVPNVDVQRARALDAGLVPGESTPTAAPLLLGISFDAPRLPGPKLQFAVGAPKLKPGVSRKVTMNVSALAAAGKPALDAGTKTYTLTGPKTHLLNFALSAAAAPRLNVGHIARLTIRAEDGKILREKDVDIVKPG